MAIKDDRKKRPTTDDDDDKKVEDNLYDDDPDDDDDDNLEKSVAVVNAKELAAFIDASVTSALVKALGNPEISTALAKAIAPELGIGRLRKSMTDFVETVNDRFDALDETHETLSKALATATIAPSADDIAAKTTPAEKPLAKAVDGNGDAEPLLKPGEGAQSERARRGQLAAAAKKSGRVSEVIINKAMFEAQNGGVSDETFVSLEKACSTAGVRI